MPLLNICGVTGNNRTPQYALCFLSGETFEDYNWALNQLRIVMKIHDIPEPLCMITDREEALISSIDEHFPDSDHLLCRWHVNMNVVKNCKKHFATKAEWEAFYRAWLKVLESRNQEEYDLNLEALRLHPFLPIAYLESVWLIWKEKLVSA